MAVSMPDSFIEPNDAWPWQTKMFWVTHTINDGARMRFKVKCKLCGWGTASFTDRFRLGLHFRGERGVTVAAVHTVLNSLWRAQVRM